MKKVLSGVFLVFIFILSSSSIIAAAPVAGDNAPHTFLNIYQTGNTAAVGLKQELWKRFYFSSNIEYLESSSDLALQAGAVYFFPHKVELGVFFSQYFSFDIYLYAGAGAQYYRNSGDKQIGLILGINYLIFFTESLYPLDQGVKPELRAGLSFGF